MPLQLRLYIAGNAPNSRRARANLQRLCAALPQAYNLEVVDVLAAPQRALEDGVTLTPTLLKLAPDPVRKVVGDLSDTREVQAVLGLGGHAAE